MPSEVRHLTRAELLAVHARVIAEFGGQDGLRDRDLLESARMRPQSGYYPDVIEMAAALFESLLMNHPFVDGNKRVAFFAADVFLRLNGLMLDQDADTAHGFLIGMLERGECNFERLASWLHEITRPC